MKEVLQIIIDMYHSTIKLESSTLNFIQLEFQINRNPIQ